MNQTSHIDEDWNFAGYINITSGYGIRLSSTDSKIQVNDQNTGGVKTLDNYPINWSAITGAPIFYTDSDTYSNLGIYKKTDYTGKGISSIACRFVDFSDGSTTTKYFYLNSSGSWVSFSPSNTGVESTLFVPLSLLAKK